VDSNRYKDDLDQIHNNQVTDLFFQFKKIQISSDDILKIIGNLLNYVYLVKRVKEIYINAKLSKDLVDYFLPFPNFKYIYKSIDESQNFSTIGTQINSILSKYLFNLSKQYISYTKIFIDRQLFIPTKTKFPIYPLNSIQDISAFDEYYKSILIFSQPSKEYLDWFQHSDFNYAWVCASDMLILYTKSRKSELLLEEINLWGSGFNKLMTFLLLFHKLYSFNDFVDIIKSQNHYKFSSVKKLIIDYEENINLIKFDKIQIFEWHNEKYMADTYKNDYLRSFIQNDRNILDLFINLYSTKIISNRKRPCRLSADSLKLIIKDLKDNKEFSEL
jgi:hypothetical protein